MHRKILYSVPCQPSTDNILIECLGYMYDFVVFSGYFLFLPSTGFFPTMSQYFCSNDII